MWQSAYSPGSLHQYADPFSNCIVVTFKRLAIHVMLPNFWVSELHTIRSFTGRCATTQPLILGETVVANEVKGILVVLPHLWNAVFKWACVVLSLIVFQSLIDLLGLCAATHNKLTYAEPTLEASIALRFLPLL